MSKAVFQDIYADIKQAIEQGTCPYQSYLPSENELKELYDCSRATIRRAIASLAAEGYVQAQQGKGVRVIRDLNAEPPRGMDGLETFKELSLRRNFTLVTKTIIFELVVADESISRVTGFPVGSDLTRAKRIRYADGVAVGTDDSYYLSSQVPGLTPEIADDSIYRYLEQDLGIKIGTGNRDVTVEHPTKEDRRCLDMGDFDTVAVVRGKTYCIDGTLLEYTETKQVPSFFSLHETVVRNNTRS